MSLAYHEYCERNFILKYINRIQMLADLLVIGYFSYEQCNANETSTTGEARSNSSQ